MERLRFLEQLRTGLRDAIDRGKRGISPLCRNTSAPSKGYPGNGTKRKPKRRKKISDNKFLILFIAMVFPLASLIILIVLLPVSMMSLWMVCSLKSIYIRRVKVHGTMSDFWLNEKQAKDYLAAALPFYQALEKLRDAYDQGTAMGLTKRKNRRFDEGSQLGKELNSIIESSEKKVQHHRCDIELMEKKPLSQWKDFNQAYVCARSYGAGLAAWIAATVLSVYIFSGDFASGFKTFFQFPFLALEDLPGMVEGFFDFQIKFGKLTMDDWTMMLIPTLASYLGYFLTELLIRNRAGKISPEPPVVTVENALKHIRNPKCRGISSRPVIHPSHNPKAG